MGAGGFYGGSGRALPRTPYVRFLASGWKQGMTGMGTLLAEPLFLQELFNPDGEVEADILESSPSTALVKAFPPRIPAKIPASLRKTVQL